MVQILNVILEGIVGSTAYGMARAGSDVDMLGVYVAPTDQVLGLTPPTDATSTVVHRDPDITHHELVKYCRLALKCNPTITELLWLDNHTVRTSSGALLVALRRSFLSGQHVRNAYFGYASQQFYRIERRESNDFSSDTKHRTAKHARHLYRLLVQGFDLWTKGKLQVQVDDPQKYFDFGDQVQAGDLDVAQKLLARYEYEFNQTPTVLPAEPDTQAIHRAVLTIRRTLDHH